MSTVDERIVEMRFDNQQFESGVQKSLKTLDQLKSGLNLENSAKSLESLQSTANSFDLSGIASGVEAVSSRVSALGIVGDQVIRYLTNQFIQLGEAAVNTVKSLTVDQVGAGFDKYERKVQSVQTIMNATGMTVKEVGERLNKLNWFTDETSYSFTDMVDNIGKFTSSNVPLDLAVTSMIGIADAAGLAGASVGDASHAMEGFSKAIAQGYMSRQNWQWIRTAHMDTAKFKDILIESATELGTLTKSLDSEGKTIYTTLEGTEVSVADFETAMKDGWITTDTMTKALGRFGNATEEIYKQYQEHDGEVPTSDIIDEMGDDLDELGLKAFRASQEAKTFTDAINSVKDAVSTGWMTSFEYIFGNKDEAVKLWTDVANEMWDVFASGGERRNEILADWYAQGGRTELIDAIYNSWAAVRSIGEAVKETFSGLIPEVTGEKLFGLTKKFNNFTSSFRDNFTVAEEYSDLLNDPELLSNMELLVSSGNVSEEGAKATKAARNIMKLKEAFGGLRSILELVGSGFKAIGRILSPLGRLFKINTGSILDFAASLGRLVTNAVESIKSSTLLRKAVSGFSSIVDTMVTSLISFADSIKYIFTRVINSETFKNITSKVLSLTNSFKSLVSEKIRKGASKLGEAFRNISVDFSSEKIINAIKKVKKAFDSFLNIIKPITSLIKNGALKGLSLLQSGFTKISGFIGKAANQIANFIENLKETDNPLELIVKKIGSFGEKVSSLADSFAKIFGHNDFKGLLDSLIPTVDEVKKRVGEMLENIGETLSNADWGKIFAIGMGATLIPVVLQIGAAFGEAAKLFKSTKGLIGTISGFFTKLQNSFKSQLVQTAQAVTLFATSIAILVGSLKLLSTIGKDELIRSGIALGALAVGLSGITLAFGLLGAAGKVSGFDKAAIGIASLAGSIAILSGSLYILKNLKVNELGRGLATIAFLMLTITSFATIIAASGVKIEGSGVLFLSFAASVLLLTEAMKRLSEVKNFNLTGSLSAIGTLMAIMGAFAIINRIGKSGFGLGPGILAMTISLIALMKIAEKLGDKGIAKIADSAKKNILLIGGVFAALAVLSGISRIGSANSHKTGFAILSMASAILVVYLAVKKFGQLNAGVLVKGLLGAIAVLGAFSRLAKASVFSSYSNRYAGKAGLTIASMAASLLAVYLAVKKFGQLDLPTLVQGLGTVIVAIWAFSKAIRATSVATKAGPIIAMAGAITLLVAALAYLTLFSVGDLAKSVGALGLAMAAFGFAVSLMSKASFDKATFAGYLAGTIALAMVAEELIRLKSIPWPQLVGSAGAISLTLIAISGAMKLASGSTFDGSSVVGFLAGLFAIWAIGNILNSITSGIGSWQNMAAAAGSISAVLIGIAAAMKITSIGGGNSLASIDGLATIIIWIVALAAVLGAISVVANEIGFDDSNVQQIYRLGAMIGGLIGGIFGGFAGGAGLGMSVALPTIADNLSAFAENIKPFIETVTTIPDGFGDKIQTLGDGLVKIGKAELKDAWANFLNMFAFKGTGVDRNLSTNITSLGTALSSFNSAMDGVNPHFLSKNIDSLISLIGIMKELPTDGTGAFEKFAGLFVGKTDYSGFSTGMSELGAALNAFATNTAGISAEAIGQSIEAFIAIIGAFNQIPETGSFIDLFSGTIKWSTISTGLEDFGKAISKYSEAVSGDIDIGSITQSATAAKELQKVFDNIPPTGGLEQKLSGSSSWYTLSTGLAGFGYALRLFSRMMSGESINVEAIKLAGEAGAALSELEGKIPKADGWIQDVFGGSSWTTISTGLADFGAALKKYSDSITEGDGIDLTAMTSAATAIDTITATFTSFKSSGLTSKALNILGGGLEGFGNHLKELSYSMAQFDVDSVNAALNAIQQLADAKSTYASLGGDIADSIVSTLEQGLSTSQATSIGTDFASALILSLNSASGAVSSVGVAIGNSFASGIRGTISGAITAATSLATSAHTAITSFYSSFYIVGQNLGQGLVNGLDSKKKAVYNAGFALGKKGADGAKDGAEEKSPSKLTIQVGEYLGEGLIVGMSHMTSSIDKAAQKMSGDSVLTIKDTFAAIDAMMGNDAAFNPVITPVLDLSEVSYGASMLTDILNSDSSIKMAGQISSEQNASSLSEFLSLGQSILREIQNGSDLYFDDGVLAGRINRRLGSI